eukprot:1196114-Prorocentrum_minimum.AAC.7
MPIIKAKSSHFDIYKPQKSQICLKEFHPPVQIVFTPGNFRISTPQKVKIIPTPLSPPRLARLGRGDLLERQNCAAGRRGSSRPSTSARIVLPGGG